MKKRVDTYLSLVLGATLVATSVPAMANETNLEIVEQAAYEVENEIMDLSLLPLESETVYLDLNEYFPWETKALTVAEVLSKLEDRKGNPVNIDPEATIVWTHFKDENGKLLKDVYKVVSREEKVDLFNASSYRTMEIIVGTGDQLDADNIRYTVRLSGPKEEKQLFDFEVCVQDEVRQQVEILSLESTMKKMDTTKQHSYELTLPNSIPVSSEIYLGLTMVNEYQDVNVQVYKGAFETVADIEVAVAEDEGVDVTNKLVDQEMTAMNAGLPINIAEGEKSQTFTAVYTKNGQVVGVEIFNVDIARRFKGLDIPGLYIGRHSMVQSKQSQYENGVEKIVFELIKGCTADEPYEFYMSYYDGESSECDNSKVDKAVIGHFDSLEAAENEEDIKDLLFKINGIAYEGSFGGEGINFTVFAQEEVYKINIQVKVQEQTGVTKPVEFDKAPSVVSVDTKFIVTGAYEKEGGMVDNYIVPHKADTYSSNGYKTVLINDKEVDLSTLKPRFEVENQLEVYVEGNKQESAKSEQDFTDGPVKYTVQTKDGANQKDYYVTFVKKVEGPKLFVNGPEQREVFLNEYYQNRHDIFIANIGDTPLTGLNISLDATNVKLDEYWTVGEESKHTLGAFELESYGNEAMNIAKIRLVADGEGEIEGTLTISADGQEPKVITLTGQAGNPKIVTEKLEEAIKGSSYSQFITTNNRHDWNEVSFQLKEGKLPKGITLGSNGELSGIPQEEGEFPITVEAQFSRKEFKSSATHFVLTVTNGNKPSDENNKPSEGDNKPSDENNKPSEGDNKPSDENNKPSEGDNKPSDENKPSNGDNNSSSGNPSGGSGSSGGGGGGGGSAASTPVETIKPVPIPSEVVTKPVVEAMNYSDVAENAWYYEDIKWAYTNQLLIGVSNNKFAPKGKITQGVVTTVFARLNETDLNAYNGQVDGNIPQDKWYTQSMLWAKKAGILKGVKLNPNANMSRQDLAIVILNYLDYSGVKYPEIETMTHFKDEKLISENAMRALQVLYKLGIFKGTGNGNIAPNDTVTRAELATLLHRLSDLIEDNK